MKSLNIILVLCAIMALNSCSTYRYSYIADIIMYEGGKVIGEWNDAEIAYEYKNSGAYEAYYTRNGLKSNSINFVDKNGESVCLYGGGIIVRNIRREIAQNQSEEEISLNQRKAMELKYIDLRNRYKEVKKKMRKLDKYSDEYNMLYKFSTELKNAMKEISEKYYNTYNYYIF